ncbi:MAG: LysR family transcriptional regulator, partial [Oxalobacteraceae bacterium]
MLLGNAVNIVGAITNFTCVVESGTLASAARSLGVSAASVSQNIARLEEHLGVRLLARTTRQMALTEAGRVYYDKVRHIPRELDLAKQAVDKGLDLQEHLTIATLSSVGRHLLAPLLPAFGRRYPRLAIELVSAN